MRKSAIVVILLMGLVLSAGRIASAALIDVVYELYFWNTASTSWDQYIPGDGMPTGGDGGQWKYIYTVTNHLHKDSPYTTYALYWWHVSFEGEYGVDPAGDPEYDYDSSSSPTGWTASTERLLGDTDYFWARWATSTDPIPYDSSLRGFDVVFNYYGQNLPGSQHFQGGNGTSDGGYTTPVPEPTSMLLLGIGLIGLAGGKARKRFIA